MQQQEKKQEKKSHFYTIMPYPGTRAFDAAGAKLNTSRQELVEAQTRFHTVVDEANRETAYPHITAGVCCGVKEISGIAGRTKEQIQEALDEAAGIAGMVFATTVAGMAKSARVLKELGFTPVGSCHNPNSDHKVTMWVKVLHEPKDEEYYGHEDEDEDEG